MPTLGERLVTAVEQAEIDSALFKLFTQGGTVQDVVTEGGTYPSLAKFLDETFRWQGDYTPGGTDYVKGQTFEYGNAIYRVTDSFSSTAFANDSSYYEIMFDFSTMVTAAETAETNAEAAQTAAEAAQALAEAALDEFTDQYLGAKSSAPATDNDGDPLTDGDVYYDTTEQRAYVYTVANGWSLFVMGLFVQDDASATFSLDVGDLSTYRRVNATGAIDITVPPDFANVSDEIVLMFTGADPAPVLTEGAGVTVNNKLRIADASQWDVFVLKCVANNVWDLI